VIKTQINFIDTAEYCGAYPHSVIDIQEFQKYLIHKNLLPKFAEIRSITPIHILDQFLIEYIDTCPLQNGSEI